MMTRKDMKCSVISFLFLSLSFSLSFGQTETDNIDFSYINGVFNTAQNHYDAHRFKDAYAEYHRLIDIYSKSPNHSPYMISTSLERLGEMFMEGLHVKCNPDSAIHYFKLASSIYDNSSASRRLSHIYYFPRFNKQDLNESWKYLILSADQGNIKSNLEAGALLLNGKSHVLQDTTIYVIREEFDKQGVKKRFKSFHIELVPTIETLLFNNVKLDSVKGYYYYERGIDANRKLFNSDYLLNDLDFIRSYMEGTFSEIDFSKSWLYLMPYTRFDELSNDKIESHDKAYWGEIFWRIQLSYRFGLGTRVNPGKADLFLRKSAEYNFDKAIQALQITL